MQEIHVLIMDGNHSGDRATYARKTGVTQSVAYGRAVQSVAPAKCRFSFDTLFAADAGSTTTRSLAAYDAVFITGSALHVWKRLPEVTRQIDIVRAVVENGVPLFGSCWGQQIIAAALGGDVRLAGKKEGMVAEQIEVNSEGRKSGLYDNKPDSFSAFALHSDEVIAVPSGTSVLAYNTSCAVQAMRIDGYKAPIYGVQYHPEFDCKEVIVLSDWYANWLVQNDFYRSKEDLNGFINNLHEAVNGGENTVSADLTDAKHHRLELRNMLTLALKYRSENATA